jgi:hypothetical protein
MVFAAGDAVEAAVVTFKRGTVRQKLADDLYDVQLSTDAGLASNEHCVVHESLLRAAAEKSKPDPSSGATAALVRVTAPCKLENTLEQSSWKHMLISMFESTALDSIASICERRLQNTTDLAVPSSKKHTSSSSIASEYKTADSAELALAKGDAITFRVHFPGDEVIANPKESTVRFLRELHCIDIDIEINKEVECSNTTTVTGAVDVWCGTRLLATAPLSFELQQQPATAAVKKDKPSGGIGGHLKMLKTLRANNGVSPTPSPTTATAQPSCSSASGTVTPTSAAQDGNVSAATASPTAAAAASSSETPVSDVDTAASSTAKLARTVVPATAAAAVTVLDGKKPSKLSLSLTRPTSRAGFLQHTDDASITTGGTERVASDSNSTHAESSDHTNAATSTTATAAVTSGASTARQSAASDGADVSSDSENDDMLPTDSTTDSTKTKHKDDSSTDKSTTGTVDDAVEPTADDLAEAKSKLIAQLAQGLVLLKHSRNGKAVDRTVRSKDACKTITWGSESYKLSDCSEVRCGAECTEHMPKLDAALVSKTFSLMFAKRSLDFTCSDAQEMAQVSLGFKACLQGL